MVAIKRICAVAILLVSTISGRCQEREPPKDATKALDYWLEAPKRPDDSEPRNKARQALGPEGPYAKVAVPALINAFAHKKPPLDIDAVETLADYGPSVVPQLVRALERPEEPVRAAVAEALGLVNPEPVEAVSVLLQALKDPSPEVRSAAAWTLGGITGQAEKIVPCLASALRDEKDKVREAAADALNSMGRKSKPALHSLLVALEDKNERVRESSAQALWKIGPDAKKAVPALIYGLKDEKHDCSRAAMAQALSGIGPEAKEAVPALIKTIQEKDSSLRGNSAVALGKIGPSAKAAVPALISVAKCGDNSSDNAIAALGEIGPDAKAAVPMLMEALKNRISYYDNRAVICRALGGIGSPAKEAIPTLAAIARNQFNGDHFADTDMRQAAAEAVMKIDPEYGTKHSIELSYLDIHLGKIPSVKLAPRAALTEEKRKHIKKLIADLADLNKPDFGMSWTLTGSAFAPFPNHEHIGMGLVTDHRLKSSDAFRALVEMGPDALPFLLEALGDKTPTKLKIDSFGTTILGSEQDFNPLNSLERRVLSKRESLEESSEYATLARRLPTELRVGDVCFVAIGQIVGREYSAVRYQPSAITIINSQLVCDELRENVREIWSSKDPARKVLDSLLIDYATEGIFNGKSFDGWGQGSRSQIEAAVRLLYYFPKESAPLIAERLNRMNVNKPKLDNDEGWMMREVTNGVITKEFLKAITWCQEALIRKALLDIFKRTNDVSITLAVIPSVKKTQADLIVPRLQALLKGMPPSEDKERGDGYQLLIALSQHMGKECKPLFKRYLQDASLQRRWTMCRVLEKVHSEWALEFLTPMLADKRTGFGNKTMRLCDRAAMTLNAIHSDLKFEFNESPEASDRQIDQMRKQIANKGEKNGK